MTTASATGSRGVVLGAALLNALACSPPGHGTPKVQELSEAERRAEALARAGDYESARHHFETLAKHEDDEIRAGGYRLRRCDLYRSERRVDEARRCYLDLRQNLLPEEKAEAAFRAAQMEVELGREKRARRALEALVIDQPNTEAAEKGARSLLALTEAVGKLERAEIAIRLGSSLAPQGEVEQTVRALCAFFFYDAGRTLRELEHFERSASILAKGWSSGSATHWRDELFVERARSEAALHRYERALEIYVEFLDERESSWFVGSYDSPLFDDAAFERAELLRALGRIEDAIDAYDELVEEFPESNLRDDASFAAASLRAERGGGL